ncbi:hypothetical protein [Streptomyces sp. NBC_01198]|uniref:hypothetical protein n=1 Tax=Streptomyces sp. NBC_01198 TaxID=2903769 RepID=UPI002E0E13E4|nr:hypothetical protein OG702_25865 [Streptomyces sp. NBC_01198]
MSTGAIVAVVAAVIIVAAIVAAVMMQRGREGGPGLKRRFGPEYERTLARHDGDTRATRHELAERVKRYGDIEPRALSAQEQDHYTEQWASVQAKFVDSPGEAVRDADALIGRLAAERGFPAADSPEHVDALSVHHPHQVDGYREVHAATSGDGQQGTEDLRKALVSARAMFDDMLHAAGSTRRDGDADREPENVPDADADATAERNESKPLFGKRPAALTGRGRTEEEQ